MSPFLNRYTTPLTLGLFAISAVSGLALFFHVGQGIFHSMHEWLSIVLLVPFAFHLWKNWGAMLGYVRRGTLLAPAVATLVVSLAFVLPALSYGERGSPFRAVQLLTTTSIVNLAPVLKTTPDALQASLVQRGYKVVSSNDTLDTVAASSGVPAIKLLVDVVPAQ